MRTASIMPIMTITIIIAAIPYSKVCVDARPEGTEVVDVGVAEASMTLKLVSAVDGQ